MPAGSGMASSGGTATTRPVAGTTTSRSQRHATPALLKRLIITLLAATILLWVTATILQRGLQSTAESVRDSASPAYLDAAQARAALSDADQIGRAHV